MDMMGFGYRIYHPETTTDTTFWMEKVSLK